MVLIRLKILDNFIYFLIFAEFQPIMLLRFQAISTDARFGVPMPYHNK